MLSDLKAGKGFKKMKIDEMRELKGKRAFDIVNRYNYQMRVKQITVLDAYKRCSNRKYYSECEILKEKIENCGYDYTVIGFNQMMYSCAYRCGVWLVYHTRDNVYKIKYPA